MRAVPESVLEEALEQIEAMDADRDDSCVSCDVRHDSPHRPDCRYVRVRDALIKALGR
jgi:hypothetical protein